MFHSLFSRTVLAVLSGVGFGMWAQDAVAANVLWNNATSGNEWRTAGNWTPSGVPTATDVAQFGTAPSSINPATVGVETKVSPNNQVVGAIEILSTRTTDLIIGDSSNGGNGGTLTLNGQTVNGVGDVILRNNSASSLTLQPILGASSNKDMTVTLGNATNNVVVVDGTGNINISSVILGTGRNLTLQGGGTGSLVLSNGANTFSGATSINSGTLVAGATNTLGFTSGVTVSTGGTLSLGASNTVNNAAPITLAGGSIVKGAGFSEGTAAGGGFGSLTLSASSTIDFGTGGVGVLAFSGFTPGAFALTILNWTGIGATEGTASTDRLIFSGDQTANLAAINFNGIGATQISLGGGLYEIVAVPEPGAILAALLLAAPVAWRERRSFLRVRQVA